MALTPPPLSGPNNDNNNSNLNHHVNNNHLADPFFAEADPFYHPDTDFFSIKAEVVDTINPDLYPSPPIHDMDDILSLVTNSPVNHSNIPGLLPHVGYLRSPVTLPQVPLPNNGLLLKKEDSDIEFKKPRLRFDNDFELDLGFHQQENQPRPCPKFKLMPISTSSVTSSASLATTANAAEQRRMILVARKSAPPPLPPLGSITSSPPPQSSFSLPPSLTGTPEHVNKSLPIAVTNMLLPQNISRLQRALTAPLPVVSPHPPQTQQYEQQQQQSPFQPQRPSASVHLPLQRSRSESAEETKASVRIKVEKEEQKVLCKNCGEELTPKCLMRSCEAPAVASQSDCKRCGKVLSIKCILSVCEKPEPRRYSDRM